MKRNTNKLKALPTKNRRLVALRFGNKKLGRAIGAKKTTYTYLLSSWFAQDKYRDMLDYIRNEVKDCDYIIVGD